MRSLKPRHTVTRMGSLVSRRRFLTRTAAASVLVDISDKQAFMDRFVDWHVELMAKEPFDILANTTWLPAGLLEQWELYWTPPRMTKVNNAALKYGVALEISSSDKLPKLPSRQPPPRWRLTLYPPAAKLLALAH